MAKCEGHICCADRTNNLMECRKIYPQLCPTHIYFSPHYHITLITDLIDFYAVTASLMQKSWPYRSTDFNCVLSTSLCCRARLIHENYYFKAIRLFCAPFFDCVSNIWWLSPQRWTLLFTLIKIKPAVAPSERWRTAEMDTLGMEIHFVIISFETEGGRERRRLKWNI